MLLPLVYFANTGIIVVVVVVVVVVDDAFVAVRFRCFGVVVVVVVCFFNRLFD